MKFWGTAGLLIATVSSSAFAADEGFYVEATVGNQKANIPSFSVAGLTKKDSDTTYALGVGYNFNKYFGLEAGYQDLGKVAYSWTGAGTATFGPDTFVGSGAAELSAKVHGDYVGATASFPIDDHFSVNGRAGWLHWQADATFSASASGTLNGTPVSAGGSLSASTKSTDTYFGLGVTYKLNKNLGFNLGYTEYKIDEFKAKNWALGARYSF